MSKINLFWPVYKNIEKEIISLSNQIHFDDQQLSIYSVKIAELLLRCVVEIEAIAKQLYFDNGGDKEDGKDLFFDTDCIDMLETKWTLSKKQVIVTSSNFYFQNKENKILYPLKKANKRGSSSADWAKAYQAVKHSRANNLEKANLKNLIRATAALYVLNLYYRDDIFELNNNNDDTFHHSISDIFNIKVHKSSNHSFGVSQSYEKNADFDECTYAIKVTDEANEKSLNYGNIINVKVIELCLKQPSVIKYMTDNNYFDNNNDANKKLLEFITTQGYKNIIGDSEYVKILRQACILAKNETNFNIGTDLKYEAVLNKNQQIYQQA